MKILLVGNYPYLKSQSMDRFATMLHEGLRLRGHDVRLLKPQPFLGRLRPSPTGLGKWLGYWDRFVLFRPMLRRATEWADVVHICDQANAVYVPWLKGKPHVVTCHDMLAVRSALGEISDHPTGLTGRIYQRWILSGLKKAMRVVCVSQTTREDLLRITGLLPEKVSVVRNGLNYPYRPLPEQEIAGHLEKMGLADNRSFFLHVGGDFWYKNKPGLLKIFADTVRPDTEKKHRLVLVGGGISSSLRDLAADLGVAERIKAVGAIGNEALCALYATAEGLIFPSLAEGFGWPIIEAQACGCPVFTSNRKPMNEIGGNGAVYFDPEDSTGAAQIILSALKDRASLVQNGFKNIENYTTKAMLSGYIAEYRRVLR